MRDNAQILSNKLLAMNFPRLKPSDIVVPSPGVREELFEKLFPPNKVDDFLKTIPEANSQALVVADCEGVIEWASPAFTRMCGYTMQELRGRKAGSLLQGAETDPGTVKILRDGISDRKAVQTQIVNYHKSGVRYDVTIQLAPTYSASGVWNGFIAVERELSSGL